MRWEVVRMETIRDRVAGLDVHRDTVVACARLAPANGRRSGVTTEKRTFSTMSTGLAAFAGWLAERDVSTAVMEATGVYWKPVYYGLEGRVPELWLVNAAHVKRVPGRKTDLSDAEWLADVAAHGMVRPSFVPPPRSVSSASSPIIARPRSMLGCARSSGWRSCCKTPGSS